MKKLPQKITKNDVRYKIFAGEPLKQIELAIEKAQKFVQKQNYNKYCKSLSFREFKYVVAQLDNPRDYEAVLSFEEIKLLSNELEKNEN